MSNQTLQMHDNNTKLKRSHGSKALLSFLSIFFSGLVVLFMGFTFTAINTSCSTPEVYGTSDIVDEELTTGQKIQNVVTSPFRLIGGVVIYPLKALFIDFPTSLYNSFDSELVEYSEKLRTGCKRDKEEALFFLSYSDDPDAWRVIIATFRDNDPDIRKQAVLCLTKQKDLPEEAIKHIRDILDVAASDSSVLLSAIYAIGDLGDEQDIKRLKEIYEDEDSAEVFKSFTLLSLAKLGFPEAEIEAIKISKTRDIHPVMFANALLSIGYCKQITDDGKKILFDSVKSEDERIVTAALTALGVAKEFDFLEDLLKNKESSVLIKKKILVVLGEFGGEEKINLIRRYFNNAENNEIRQYAIFGLAKARYKPIVNDLIENLKYETPEMIVTKKEPQSLWVRLWSLGFLYELTGENFGIDYQPWKKWWDSNKEEFLEDTES